jgi:6-phosphogluconolactonase
MIAINEFSSKTELDNSFAEQVAQLLTAAINKKGRASIAVSGGSTPKDFFITLSQKDIAWHKVTVTLADERWVDKNSEASNTRLVKEFLLQKNAAQADFFDLKIAEKLDQDVLQQLNNNAKQQVLPFDVLILGMGEDGHTASLFPCSDEISVALAKDNTDVLMSVKPKTAPHQRITFTFAALIKSSAIFLHLCGEKKQQVLQQAMANDDIFAMPIRAFLQDKNITTTVMFAK